MTTVADISKLHLESNTLQNQHDIPEGTNVTNLYFNIK